MSRRLVRLLIAFLLAFAVPLHGFAGTSAAPCKATHGEHEQHAHSSGEHSQSQPDAGPSSGEAHCATCVACCAGVAIQLFACALITDRRAESPFAAPASSIAGIQPEQLDRPPSRLLA